MKVKKYEKGVEIGVGYYSEMPNEDYHAHEGSVSKSGLDLIDRDPYHLFNKKQKPQTRQMEVGSAIHAAILEPDLFKSEYMMLPEVEDRRKPEYKEAVKSFGAGKVFTSNDCENIQNMQNAVWKNDEARRLLSSDGYCELSGFSKDPATGIMCRHRFDKLNVKDGWAVDIKKTQDVRSEKFSRSVFDYRYHVQDAFYLDQYEWITGERLKGFKFIAIEEQYPHKVAIFQLDDISIEIGRNGVESSGINGYRQNLDFYAKCLENRDIVHNNSSSTVLSLPDWVLRQYEEDLI